MSRPTIITFGERIRKFVPKEHGSWDLYRWRDGMWNYWDNVGQDTFDRIVDQAVDLAELIDQVAEIRQEAEATLVGKQGTK